MKIIKIYPRGFGANCYAITTDNKTAVVIDPSQPRVKEELEKQGLTAKYVLLTHCHFDHVGGVSALQNAGAKVFCSEAEKPLIGTDADLFELFGAPRTAYAIDGTFRDNQTETLCGVSITALLTPGHTAGSVCYLIQDERGAKHLFTGDTLFSDSIGRTDFPTGDYGTITSSLRRLKNLQGDMPVYAGHNDDTSLETERKHNLFLVDL